MKKTMMFVLMLLACLLVMPAVYAAEDQYPTVENITNENTLLDGEVQVIGGGSSSILIVVKDAKFKLLAHDADGTERGVENDDKAWVGLRFTMPEGATNVKIDGNEETLDENNKFDEYFGFDLEMLNKTVEDKFDSYSKTWNLTWGDEDANKVVITLDVYLPSITLVAKDSDTISWNEEKYLETANKVKLTINQNVTWRDGSSNKYTFDLYFDKGAKLTEEYIASLMMGSDLYFLGAYKDEAAKTKFDYSKALDTNTTIYVRFSETKPVEKTKDEKNPATGDNLLTYVSLSIIALTGALGTGLYLKKVNE